jgi:predicted Zn-dependent peptidase
MVDRMFSTIAPGTPPAPRTFPAVRLTKDRRVTVEADVEAPRVVVAWPTPPPHAHGSYELDFAAGVIAGMTSHKLETEQKIARDVKWGLAPGRLGSLMEIDVAPEPKGSVEAAIDAIEARVRWTAQIDRYEWTDFASSRTQRMADAILSLSDVGERAERIQDYLEYFGKADSAQTVLRRIQAVRPGTVQIAVVGDPSLADSLRALGLGEVTVRRE